jgi:hypothetical protein
LDLRCCMSPSSGLYNVEFMIAAALAGVTCQDGWCTWLFEDESGQHFQAALKCSRSLPLSNPMRPVLDPEGGPADQCACHPLDLVTSVNGEIRRGSPSRLMHGAGATRIVSRLCAILNKPFLHQEPGLLGSRVPFKGRTPCGNGSLPPSNGDSATQGDRRPPAPLG